MRHDTDHTAPAFTAAAEQLRATVREAVEQVTTAWKGMVAAIGPIMPMLRRRAALLDARRAHRADGYRDYRHERNPPSGCAMCGGAEHQHPIFGYRYQAPSDELVLERMRARRADRQ